VTTLSQDVGGGYSILDIVERQSRRLGASPYVMAANGVDAVSYEDLAELVARWGRRVDVEHVRPGDRVGVVIADPLHFTVGFVTALCAGVWIAPLDPYVAGADVEQLNRQVGRLELAYVLSDYPHPLGVDVTWIDLTQPVLSESLEGRGFGHANGGVVLSSSGTTGAPKVMSLSTEQLLLVATSVARHNALDEHERGLNTLPLWHINAEVVGLLATLVAGASLVLDDRFHRTGFWSLVDRMKVTWINAVPAIIARLASLEEGETISPLVRFVRSASAPLSATVLDRFERATSLPVIESYGMTEAASQICVNPLEGPRKAGSVGRPVGVDVRVTRVDDGAVALVNEVGEVEIKGDSVIRRYDALGYEDRFNADGWLRTMDLGYFDEDGFLFLVGRSDDVINRGGEKIFPREIEEMVLAFDTVVSAALVGVTDEVYGQVPVLFVQLRPDIMTSSPNDLDVGVKAIRDTLVATVARTRRPSHINVVDAMPSNATGKIRRKDLETGLVSVVFREPVL
jgi:acyl-CoA synthetase (AMP-forming)/AMP-acid ligase II